MPIIYIDTPALSDNSNQDPIVAEVKKRQWINLTNLRHVPWGSPEITSQIAVLGKQISDLIERNSKITSLHLKDNVLLQTVEELSNTVLTPTISKSLLGKPKDDDLSPRLLTIFLHPTGDNERDRRRIKNLYGILISAHGIDHFQFQVFENGRGHLIDFPNDTTRICTDMLDRLRKLMGEEAWRIEEITYQ